LERPKFKRRAGIALDHPLDESVAQIADAVKKKHLATCANNLALPNSFFCSVFGVRQQCSSTLP